MNLDLLEKLLGVAMTSSVLVCAFIQKTKVMFKTSKFIMLYSFIVNMIIGILFTLSFTDYSWLNGLWVGILSFIGADSIYKALEGKLKPHNEILGVIERKDK